MFVSRSRVTSFEYKKDVLLQYVHAGRPFLFILWDYCHALQAVVQRFTNRLTAPYYN